MLYVTCIHILTYASKTRASTTAESTECSTYPQMGKGCVVTHMLYVTHKLYVTYMLYVTHMIYVTHILDVTQLQRIMHSADLAQIHISYAMCYTRAFCL